jgi:hypothetical protein
MSQFNDELFARVATAKLANRADPPGDDGDQRLADVRSWYLKQLVAHKTEWLDLTPFEQEFMTEMAQAFELWRRSRPQPQPN